MFTNLPTIDVNQYIEKHVQVLRKRSSSTICLYCGTHERYKYIYLCTLNYRIFNIGFQRRFQGGSHGTDTRK